MQKAIETLNIIILALFAIVATACSEDERDAMGNDPVAANFSFSVSSESSRNIRMIPNMAQQNGAAFRGIQDVYIVPFKVTRKVQETDMASRVFLNSNVTEYDRTLAHSMFYYFDNCTFLPGVGALLFYGRAIISDIYRKYNGLEHDNKFDVEGIVSKLREYRKDRRGTDSRFGTQCKSLRECPLQ